MATRKPTVSRDGYTIHAGYRIRKRGAAYQLDLGRASGKHLRRQFDTLEAAKIEADAERLKLTNNGLAARGLDDRARLDAVDALGVLAPFAVTLTEAAEYFADRHAAPEDIITLGDLRERYLADAAAGTHRAKGKKLRKLA